MTPSAEALREAKQICRCNCDRPHGFHREYCRTGTAEAVAAALSRVMAERDAARMAARFADDKFALMMNELNDRDEAAVALALDNARREEAEGKRLVSGAMGYMANQAAEDDRHCGHGLSGCYRWVQEAKVFLGISARHGGGG